MKKRGVERAFFCQKMELLELKNVIFLRKIEDFIFFQNFLVTTIYGARFLITPYLKGNVKGRHRAAIVFSKT